MQATNKRLTVWLIGRENRVEFRSVLRALEGRADVCKASSLANRSEWWLLPEPDLVVVLQSYAGELDQNAASQIMQIHPLAPFLCVLGTYCEGETRSGQPLENAHRVFWYNAEAQLLAGLADSDHGICPWWSHPTTSTPEEVWLRRAQDRASLTGRVAVFAAAPQIAEPTIDWLASCGIEPVFIGPGLDEQSVKRAKEELAGVHCALWDGARTARQSPVNLAAAVKWASPAPLIALLTFPRTHDVQKAQSIGVARTLPKLISMKELAWHLGDLMDRKNERANGICLHDPAA